MSHSIAKLSYALPLLLLACGQPSTTDTDTSAAQSPLMSSNESASELARPQPEIPVCAFCSAGLGAPIVANDDELAMAINSAYIGLIDGAQFVVYTNTNKLEFTLDQAVVDDLNDSMTVETVVMMEFPDAVRALLVFDIDGTKYYEPVIVD